jgi:hypothetical protein
VFHNVVGEDADTPHRVRKQAIALGYLFVTAVMIQGTLHYLSLWFPRASAAINVMATGTVLSVIIWVVLEAKKETTVAVVTGIARGRVLSYSRRIGGAVVAASIFFHPVQIACAQDVELALWQGSDDHVFHCAQGEVVTKLAVGLPSQPVVISEGKDRLGKRGASETGILQATTIRYPADFSPPPFAVVVPEERALASYPASGLSPFFVTYPGESKRVPFPKEGLLVGTHALPESARVEYRQHVASGFPKPLEIPLTNGASVELTFFYTSSGDNTTKSCGPLTIDPGVATVWTFSSESCPR